MFWNDETLSVESYNLKNKHYYCGKELLKFDTIKTKIYTLLVIDLDECCCADIYSDGEIVTRFKENSYVPKKHKKGGQSAHRYSQNRDNAIIQWFKKINEKLKSVNGDIYLGISPIYQKRFTSYLTSYNKEKIKRIDKTEYSNLSGIYQYMNKLETEKEKTIK